MLNDSNTVGNSGLCCCVPCYTHDVHRALVFPLCVDSDIYIYMEICTNALPYSQRLSKFEFSLRFFHISYALELLLHCKMYTSFLC